MDHKAYLQGYLCKVAGDVQEVPGSTLRPSSVPTQTTPRKIHQQIYTPEKSKQYINDAQNWQKSHPNTPFLQNTANLDNPIDVAPQRNLAQDWGASGMHAPFPMQLSNNQPAFQSVPTTTRMPSKVYYDEASYPANDASSSFHSTIGHEGIGHEMSKAPFPFPFTNYTNTADTDIIQGETGLSDNEIAPTLNDMKYYGRQSGMESKNTQSAQDLLNYFDKATPAMRQDEKYPAYFKEHPELLQNQTFRKTVIEQLPGFVQNDSQQGQQSQQKVAAVTM